MGRRNRQRHKNKKRQSIRVLVAGQEYPGNPHPIAVALSDRAEAPTTLKPPTSTSTSTSSSSANHSAHVLGGHRFPSGLFRTLQVCALLTAVFYFTASELLVSAVAVAGFAISFVCPQENHDNHAVSMWTLTQFETFGALRVDQYLRFLVTKLAVVWRAIVTLHKTAVNYSFTVSISEKPSLADLQGLLEGRVPLMLTYDNVKTAEDSEDDEKDEYSRRSSLASTAMTDDCFRESMDLSGLDLDVARSSFMDYEKTDVTEYLALEDQDVAEYFTIEDDGWSEVGSEPAMSDAGEEEILSSQKDEAPPKSFSKRAFLRSILVPLLPLGSLSREQKEKHSTAQSSPVTPLEPLVVPHVKPLIEQTNKVTWSTPATARPEAAALLSQAKTASKRRISVNVTSMKPLPRLVVKARPSTLTPPQNVQRMLDQVEKMMREVHDLLVAGREVLQKVDTPEEQEARKNTKTVRFSDDLEVIEAVFNVESDDDERELRSSLSYGAEEIESMSDEFFSALPLSPAC